MKPTSQATPILLAAAFLIAAGQAEAQNVMERPSFKFECVQVFPDENLIARQDKLVETKGVSFIYGTQAEMKTPPRLYARFAETTKTYEDGLVTTEHNPRTSYMTAGRVAKLQGTYEALSNIYTQANMAGTDIARNTFQNTVELIRGLGALNQVNQGESSILCADL